MRQVHVDPADNSAAAGIALPRMAEILGRPISAKLFRFEGRGALILSSRGSSARTQSVREVSKPKQGQKSGVACYA